MKPEDFNTIQLREYYEKKLHEVPDFDPSWLDVRFAPFYRTGVRIRVTEGGRKKTGLVSVSAGPRPVFLLMRRKTDSGSGTVLSSSVDFPAEPMEKKP